MPITLAVDAILVLVPLEAMALYAWHRLRGGGIAPGALLANLAAGLCLAAALRFALAGPPQPLAAQAGIAALLAGAGLAHLADLAARWR